MSEKKLIEVRQGMRAVAEHLDAADFSIDTRMNCNGPEFEAADHLRNCLRELLAVVKQLAEEAAHV